LCCTNHTGVIFCQCNNLSEFVTEMSKNNRFRINGLSRDPGSMNFGTLLKRHPNDWDVSRKVFIGGLRGDGGTKDRFDIEFHFSEVGKVTDVWISQKYGFAYVEMEDQKTALKAIKELNGTFMCGGTVTVEMAKRDDQKRKERELDLHMRWGDSKEGKSRDKVRDRGRSRSRSEERTPGLYAIAPLLRDTHIFVFFAVGKVRVGFLSIILCMLKV